MTFRPRANHPYAHAPRLPDEGQVTFADLLPGDGPIEIEIGPGRGGFLFERGAARPDVRIVGFEIRLKWSALVDERLHKMKLAPRVRCLNGDAKQALPRLEPDACVDVVYLHFPDPWWKKRHEKRLVMGDVVLDQIARLLRDGAALFVQTDVEERAQQYEEQIRAHAAFRPLGDVEGDCHLAENPYEARSPREHHAIRDGLPVHRLRFARVAR
jgi:tRNA (guanine-N7-)-methyltransferase